MPGFSGSTGVPLKQMQDAIAQSTATETTTISFTDESGTVTATLCKFGKMVIAHIPTILSKQMTAWQEFQLFTIPNGYKPKENVRFVRPIQSFTGHSNVYFLASSDGRFMLNNQGPAETCGTSLATAVCWITA